LTYYNQINLADTEKLLDQQRHLWSKKKGLVAKPRGNKEIEDFQEEAWLSLCDDDATHILIAGGARSGKTYLILKWMIIRAFHAPEGSQAILRFRFNHLKASIIGDTLPMVCKMEWPGERLFYLNRSDWFAEFSNGHKMYFGGLDDKERTEKILGQGHCTIFNNECSQISYGSRNKAVTRLSQKIAVPGSRFGFLPLKEINDENPPMQGHWSYRLWVEGRDPSSGSPLSNVAAYRKVFMQPANNPHIPEATKEILRNLPKRERVRFWEGKFGEAVDNALWTYESIEMMRVDIIPITLVQVVVAIDPSGSKGNEDKRSDEVGIIVAGIDNSDVVHILEDASGRHGPQGEDGWGAIAASLFYKWKADRVVAEVNYGGAMVQAVIQSADADIPFKEVTATRGKAIRAEPVSMLCETGRVKLVGAFPELEEQLLQFSSAGYKGDKSPDRADAMVWAVTDLAVDMAPGLGLLEWYKRQAAKQIEDQSKTMKNPAVIERPKDKAGVTSPMDYANSKAGSGINIQAPLPSDEVILNCPDDMTGTFYALSGKAYNIENGTVKASRKFIKELLDTGFSIKQ
jgi:hypothetical protein